MKKVIGTLDPSHKSVTIIGAGFSGLVLGFYLKKAGRKVTILEKSSQPGGKIRTTKTNMGLSETGAHALFLNEDGLDLLKDLNITPVPAQKKLRRLVFTKGKPRSPLRLSTLVRFLTHATVKPPLLKEGLSVADFFRPLLGQELVDQLVSPALSGVYATNAEHLHFKSVFDQFEESVQLDSYWDFLKRVRKKKSKLPIQGTVSFEGGMQGLIDKLSQELKSEIKYNQKSVKLEGNVIICTEASAAAKILETSHPELAQELRRVRYQPLTSATVFLRHELKPLSKAFGVVIPTGAGLSSIGILNNRAIFPGHYENTLSYSLISPKKLTHEEIIGDLQKVSSDFQADDLEGSEITYWEEGIPLYDLQRYLSIKKINQLLRKPGLAIFGNYVAGISLREMIKAAKSFAEHNQG
jgi:oxygen-dependent protoporphyrinogen oxidase